MKDYVRLNEASKMLGVSKGNLSYQIRNGTGPMRNLGCYCPPVPGNDKGQYVFYRNRIEKFIKGEII